MRIEGTPPKQLQADAAAAQENAARRKAGQGLRAKASSENRLAAIKSRVAQQNVAAARNTVKDTAAAGKAVADVSSQVKSKPKAASQAHSRVNRDSVLRILR